ncbi:MAG: hypothetical protein L3J34_07665 [Flavobacteriaceae bacterium]|nr:hypothetical protein [Flavobacteriaceae bacterium]
MIIMDFLKLLFIFFISLGCQDGDDLLVVDDDLLVIDDVTRKLKIERITNLDNLISETSGLINFNGRLITHNDSGGKPSLYEIGMSTIVETN